jgi:hypothetical protein
VERRALEEARDELLADPDPLYGRPEALGRVYHWLDEPEEARRRLLQAAEHYKTIPDDPGRVGGILWLAGEDGREWFERALQREGRPDGLAGLRYLLGDDAGALAEAAKEPDPLPRLRGIAALARDDIRKARSLFAEAIRRERLRPWEDSSGDIGLYGWLEETYRREARLTGKPLPDHATMIDGVGPARPRKRKAIDAPPPEGTRVELDGSRLEVDDEGDVTITLPDGQITLVKMAGVYTVTVRGEELPQRYKGFGEAIDAIGDDRVRALADASFS